MTETDKETERDRDERKGGRETESERREGNRDR